MGYSLSLAERIRHALRGRRGIAEQRMFGGLAFLSRGNMLVAVWEHSLIARLGAERSGEALREPHVREFDVTGKPMRGWIVVDPDGLESETQLAAWIERAEEFVATLPAKPAKRA